MSTITPEEAITIRDKEMKEYREGKLLKHPNGKTKKGVNGKPLLLDALKYETVYEDVETTDENGKLQVETVKTKVRSGGYQITLN